MASRTVLDCDNCGAHDIAERIGPLDLGSGPRVLDLCIPCQDVVGLPKLQALVDEYGVVLPSRDGARYPSGSRRQCPVCVKDFAGRRAAISHCVARHGMTEVQASHAVPPDGVGAECPVCGFLCQEGTGLAQHAAIHANEPSTS